MLDFTITAEKKLWTLTFTDPDDPLTSFGQHVVTSSDSRMFFRFNRVEAEGNTYKHYWDLYVYEGAGFNHEAEPVVEIKVDVDASPASVSVGGGHETVSTTLTLRVEDINEAPTDISLNTASVYNSFVVPAHNGSVFLGVVRGIDPDAIDDGVAGDPHNNFGALEFTLDGQSSDGFSLVKNARGETELYLDLGRGNLDYVNRLAASITITDNAGAPEDERLSYSETFHVTLDHELTLTTPDEITLEKGRWLNNYEGFVFRGNNAGGGIYVSGADGALLTVTLQVEHGKLSTGGQKIGNHATQSTKNTDTNKNELTFTDIDEHDLSALLEGLVYTPDKDYNKDNDKDADGDALEISVSDGTTTKTSNTPIAVNAVDDAGTIIDFGNHIIEQNLIETVNDKSLVTVRFETLSKVVTNEAGVEILDLRVGDIVREEGTALYRGQLPSDDEDDETDDEDINLWKPKRIEEFDDDSGVPDKPILAKNVEDALIDTETTWSVDQTSAADVEGGTRIIRYYLPTTRADANTWAGTLKATDHLNGAAAIAGARKIALDHAIAEIEKVANIDFQRVYSSTPDKRADLIFFEGNIAIADVVGFANRLTFHKNGDIAEYETGYMVLKSGDTGVRGSELWNTALHELAHTIGLRHPNLQQGVEDNPYLSSSEAIYANTVMSYYNKAGNQNGKRPTDLQIYDILALQKIYGVNENANSGDTVYDFSTSALMLGYHTIYDRGGDDTFKFENGTNLVLDLAIGARSKLPNASDFVIAHDTIIENVIGTVNADKIYGNDADNVFEGNGGADYLDGRNGNDTASYENVSSGVQIDLAVENGEQDNGDALISIENLLGSAHDDVLIGNRDHNRLDGGNGGDDVLTGGGGRDTFVVELGMGRGHDTITDWQIGIDHLVFRVEGELLDMVAAFQAGVFGVRRPDFHTWEVFMTAAPEEDYVTIKFTDSVAGINKFRTALGGNEFYSTEEIILALEPVELLEPLGGASGAI